MLKLMSPNQVSISMPAEIWAQASAVNQNGSK